MWAIVPVPVFCLSCLLEWVKYREHVETMSCLVLCGILHSVSLGRTGKKFLEGNISIQVLEVLRVED